MTTGIWVRHRRADFHVLFRYKFVLCEDVRRRTASDHPIARPVVNFPIQSGCVVHRMDIVPGPSRLGLAPVLQTSEQQKVYTKWLVDPRNT